MTPAWRKLNLTAHVTSSVAWLGAVGSFLVLSIAGLASKDAETVRAAYVAMNLIGQFIIVPLGVAALLSGLVVSLGTNWGLFRHYWVLAKLILSAGAFALLLLHQFTAVAGAARRVSASVAGTLPDVSRLGIQLVGDAAGAVLVLLVATALGVYKPWGRTAYGRRKLQEERRQGVGATSGDAAPPVVESQADRIETAPLGVKIFFAILGVIALVFIVVHLAGGGLGTHH